MFLGPLSRSLFTRCRIRGASSYQALPNPLPLTGLDCDGMQERAQMAAELKRLEAEEQKARLKKKEQARLLLSEVAQSNAEQIERKKEVQRREALEDAQIAEYLREKVSALGSLGGSAMRLLCLLTPRSLQAAREGAELAKQEALKKIKEEETARMRAQQERAQDKQSELDELRARRYQEAYEREWRMKEAAAAERQRQINADLMLAREAQQQAKLKQMADQAVSERQEFERILRANRAKEAEEAQQVTNLSIALLQAALLGLSGRNVAALPLGPNGVFAPILMCLLPQLGKQPSDPAMRRPTAALAVGGAAHHPQPTSRRANEPDQVKHRAQAAGRPGGAGGGPACHGADAAVHAEGPQDEGTEADGAQGQRRSGQILRGAAIKEGWFVRLRCFTGARRLPRLCAPVSGTSSDPITIDATVTRGSLG